jgi:hypothetical protein
MVTAAFHSGGAVGVARGFEPGGKSAGVAGKGSRGRVKLIWTYPEKNPRLRRVPGGRETDGGDAKPQPMTIRLGAPTLACRNGPGACAVVGLKLESD